MSLDKKRKQVKYITVSAMLCALSIIILMLGSFIEVLDVSVAVIASFFCIYAVIEMGGAYPWMIWAATSILSLLLLLIAARVVLLKVNQIMSLSH